MITREQVADLQPGDVVEIAYGDGSDYSFRGPAVKDGYGGLRVGPNMVRGSEGDPGPWMTEDNQTLTIISRAPRSLYVNHSRTEPVAGDVVRDADSDDPTVWIHADPAGATQWARGGSYEGDWWFDRSELPERLRLLVDGETGQVVQ